MLEQEIMVINRLGLHARASAKLTQLATRFKSEIWLTRNGRRVNGKSIMGVMMLAAAQGTTVKVEVHGEDEPAALLAMAQLFATRFGEDV